LEEGFDRTIAQAVYFERAECDCIGAGRPADLHQDDTNHPFLLTSSVCLLQAEGGSYAK
jgi:hypothetical protein